MEPESDFSAQISGRVTHVDDWYEPGERAPQKAWVVEWVDPNDLTPIMHRAVVELGDDPAVDSTRQQELIGKADSIIAAGRPNDPSPFGFATTGSETREELHERLKLTIFALDAASGRAVGAAQRKDESTAAAISVAIVEMMAWLRGFDELAKEIWWKAVTPAVRREASDRTDEYLERLTSPPDELALALSMRQDTGKAYSDWTLALVAKGKYLSRDELQGFRWLAGKLLHLGPLPMAEMRHWRAGEEPRWKWRPADQIAPPNKERHPDQRAAYERCVSGRDIVGTVSMIDALIEAEYLFYQLLRDSNEEEGLEWNEESIATT